MTQEENLLARFPKQRPELPEAYRNIYVEHYRRNRDGASTASSLAMKMEAWMHRKVAADVSRRRNFTTLEIGAGNLNHLGYEPLSKSYDIVEPFEELYKGSPFGRGSRTCTPISTRLEAATSIGSFPSPPLNIFAICLRLSRVLAYYLRPEALCELLSPAKAHSCGRWGGS